ncbi:hypothetical protein CYMTET_55737 [Cymbomonas tetramitiformis]|uniref:Peptidase C2 calpain large subunit domain-containing protein n=1 Tax=Cymbomonas tetramitiformis TaxID=36881 RepID=A0AAE0BCE3_9CHLO|nr:hypothetical protein CYMTET_55737 [Cymbomonas tetramitiformis]
MGWKACQPGERRRYTVKSKTASFWNKREVSLRATLEPPGALVVPSTYEAGINNNFWISVRTRQVANISSAAASWHSIAKDFRSTEWSGSSMKNTVRIACRAGMPGARVVIFLHQSQARQHHAHHDDC